MVAKGRVYNTSPSKALHTFILHVIFLCISLHATAVTGGSTFPTTLIHILDKVAAHCARLHNTYLVFIPNIIPKYLCLHNAARAILSRAAAHNLYTAKYVYRVATEVARAINRSRDDICFKLGFSILTVSLLAAAIWPFLLRVYLALTYRFARNLNHSCPYSRTVFPCMRVAKRRHKPNAGYLRRFYLAQYFARFKGYKFKRKFPPKQPRTWRERLTRRQRYHIRCAQSYISHPALLAFIKSVMAALGPIFMTKLNLECYFLYFYFQYIFFISFVFYQCYVSTQPCGPTSAPLTRPFRVPSLWARSLYWHARRACRMSNSDSHREPEAGGLPKTVAELDATIQASVERALAAAAAAAPAPAVAAVAAGSSSSSTQVKLATTETMYCEPEQIEYRDSIETLILAQAALPNGAWNNDVVKGVGAVDASRDMALFTAAFNAVGGAIKRKLQPKVREPNFLLPDSRPGHTIVTMILNNARSGDDADTAALAANEGLYAIQRRTASEHLDDAAAKVLKADSDMAAEHSKVHTLLTPPADITGTAAIVAWVQAQIRDQLLVGRLHTVVNNDVISRLLRATPQGDYNTLTEAYVNVLNAESRGDRTKGKPPPVESTDAAGHGFLSPPHKKQAKALKGGGYCPLFEDPNQYCPDGEACRLEHDHDRRRARLPEKAAATKGGAKGAKGAKGGKGGAKGAKGHHAYNAAINAA
jgi:hypothetical protein